METTDWNAVNPMALWRDWIVKSEAQWSQGLSELLKDENANRMFGRQLDEVRMMQRQFSEVAQASLALFNLPSRSDLEAMDERLGRIEDGLAQVAAAVSRLQEALVAQQVVASSAPSRTRRASAAPKDTEAPVQAAGTATAATGSTPKPRAAAKSTRASAAGKATAVKAGR